MVRIWGSMEELDDEAMTKVYKRKCGVFRKY